MVVTKYKELSVAKTMALHKWDIWAKSVLFKLKENKLSERNYK